MAIPQGNDLELLATDISDAIAKGEWPGIDVSSEDILPYLPEFLAQIIAHSERTDQE